MKRVRGSNMVTKEIGLCVLNMQWNVQVMDCRTIHLKLMQSY